LGREGGSSASNLQARGGRERRRGLHGCHEWRPSMVGKHQWWENSGIQAPLMPKTNGRLRGRRLGLLGRGRARSSTASVGRCRGVLGAGLWSLARRGFGCRGWASGWLGVASGGARLHGRGRCGWPGSRARSSAHHGGARPGRGARPASNAQGRGAAGREEVAGWGRLEVREKGGRWRER
jgi:hypothetical protein